MTQKGCTVNIFENWNKIKLFQKKKSIFFLHFFAQKPKAIFQKSEDKTILRYRSNRRMKGRTDGKTFYMSFFLPVSGDQLSKNGSDPNWRQITQKLHNSPKSYPKRIQKLPKWPNNDLVNQNDPKWMKMERLSQKGGGSSLFGVLL